MKKESSPVSASTMIVEACCTRWDFFTTLNPSSADSKFLLRIKSMTVARAYRRKIFRACWKIKQVYCGTPRLSLLRVSRGGECRCRGISHGGTNERSVIWWLSPQHGLTPSCLFRLWPPETRPTGRYVTCSAPARLVGLWCLSFRPRP